MDKQNAEELGREAASLLKDLVFGFAALIKGFVKELKS